MLPVFVTLHPGGRRRAVPAGVHQLHLEAVLVGEIAGVVVGPAGVGMLVGEQQGPAVGRRGVDQGIDLVAGVEGEVVQAGALAVVHVGAEGGGLLEDDVGVAEPPAAAGGPVLVHHIAELAEQPAPAAGGPRQVGHPQLDVVQAPDHARRRMTIGISRAPAFSWKSSRKGFKAAILSHSRDRSSPAATTATAGYVEAPTSTVTEGLATRLWYQDGWVALPRLAATTTRS